MAFKTKFNPNKTSQRKPIPGRPDMVKNRGGGYVFQIDQWEALRRFLTIGSMGGTYYAKEAEITEEAYLGLVACLKASSGKVIDLIVEVSDKGLALKNDYALYALAVCTLPTVSGESTRRAAFKALPQVARTGTHLFQFVAYRESLGGGWGKLMREAIQGFYRDTPLDKLTYQVVKYQQRDGWSHRDLLRLSHVRPGVVSETAPDYSRHVLLRWIVDGLKGHEASSGKGKHPITEARPPLAIDQVPRIVEGFELAKGTRTVAEIVKLISEYKLTREMIPTEFLNKPEVQAALLPFMPIHALIRNLGNLTKSGLLTPTSEATRTVIGKLSDAAQLERSRVHPFALFVALNTYKSGHGLRGGGSWTPLPRVIDALDDAMYATVKNIPVSGKGVVVGIDGSGSMGEHVADLNCSVRDAAVAMALFTIKAEPGSQVVGFSQRAWHVPISPKQRVDDAVNTFMRHVEPTNTDCSLPIMVALEEKWRDVAAFITYTDNETWAGPIHPHQALQDYRRKFGIESAHVAVAMTATKYSIADDKDARSLNVVGFSADAAKVIGDFIAR